MKNQNRKKYSGGHRSGFRMTGALGALGAMLTAGLLSACMPGYDVPADFPCPQENLKGTYTLDLKIAAGNLSARSSGHGNVDGDAAENFINVSSGDYAVFIFDGDGNFVQRFEPGAVSLEMDGEHDYVYHINGAFRPENELEKLQVLVLANWRTGFGGNYNGFEDRLAAQLTETGRNSTSLAWLYGNADDFNFMLPVQTGTSGTEATVNTSWMPMDNWRGIAMFGWRAIDISERTMLGNSIVVTPESAIPMLRALAKIEVMDMVPGGANIEKCVLTTYNTTGRFIPDGTANFDWDKETTQVTSPSLPADLIQSGGRQSAPAGKNLQFFKGSRTVRTKGATDAKDCFTVYIPEMDLRSLDKENRPVVLIYINGVEKPYTVELTDYDKDGKPIAANAYASLLRNHVYRYNILSVGINAELTLIIDTPYWDLDDDQFWDYEDAEPTFDEPFTWKDFEGNFWGTDESKAGGFDNLDDDMYRILLIGNSEETAAYGYFNMSTPATNNPGIWTIALVSDDGTNNDHFKIEVKNSDEEWISQGQGDSYTATIGDDPVEFRIMATGTNGSSVDYTARIVMAVKTFDGRLVNIALRSKYDKYPNTTITDPNDSGFYFMVKQRTNGGDNM